jgi:site-specific DNA-methyltransferase (adenine-specific)
MSYKLYQGANLPVLKTLKANSVDAIITDTPYGTEKGEWDSIPNREQMVEILRVAKPGAYMAAFGAARTHHKLMNSIEAAGWEIKDVLMWLYGSGFTASSLNIGKAIDQLYGEEGQEVDGVYEPASPEGQEFAGFGIGLKPAWEPIILARKPSDGSVAETLVTHGTGALDIANSMIEEDPNAEIADFRDRSGRKRRRIPGTSRWPANLAMDEEAAQMVEGLQPGASRFFFKGKAAPSEREAGTQNLPGKSDTRGRSETLKRNHHPTVKPLALMRWLTRMIAPSGAVVLDPWMGSGSTGCAVGQEGGRFFIGIELIQEFYDIAEARIAHWTV